MRITSTKRLNSSVELFLLDFQLASVAKKIDNFVMLIVERENVELWKLNKRYHRYLRIVEE